jgi:hypothetical protein
MIKAALKAFPDRRIVFRHFRSQRILWELPKNTRKNNMSSSSEGISTGTSASHSRYNAEGIISSVSDSHESSENQPKKKKPRHKKKDKIIVADDSNHNHASPVCSGPDSRPGKKRLRKMKYQQEQLSPVEFLPHCAENARFTGSISMKRLNDLDRSSEASSRIQIVTTCLPVSEDPDDKNSDDAKSLRIQIKPLLVLDLNGVLCHRIRLHKEPTDAPYPSSYRPILDYVANTDIIPRPDVASILQFLDQHFCLALWTSAKPKTAKLLVQALVPPEIANRLLFVWGQDRCRVVASNESVGPTFEKDLAQVWTHFPLWNGNNTLLMDDSPEKCLSWQHNAIHPPPLNGRIEGATTTAVNGETIAILSDEENTRRQRDFFAKLIEHWSKSPAVQEWDSEAGDATFQDSNRCQFDFLKEHAAGHMGWQ